MALNTLKCNHLMPLPFKGLMSVYVRCHCRTSNRTIFSVESKHKNRPFCMQCLNCSGCRAPTELFLSDAFAPTAPTKLAPMWEMIYNYTSRCNRNFWLWLSCQVVSLFEKRASDRIDQFCLLSVCLSVALCAAELFFNPSKGRNVNWLHFDVSRSNLHC